VGFFAFRGGLLRRIGSALAREIENGLVNATRIYPDVCGRVFRREVLFTRSAWDIVCRSIEDGMVYGRIRDRKYAPATPMNALFHVITGIKTRQVFRCDGYATFRCLLRYSGMFHLHVLRVQRYEYDSNMDEAVLVSLPIEMGG